MLCCAPLAAQVALVDNSADSGTGTLRDVLTTAVDDTNVSFDLNTNNTITLLSALPSITANNLTIDGYNDGINQIILSSVSGFFNTGAGVDSFTLSNITLQDAFTIGGTNAFYLGADTALLSLNNTTFQNNTQASATGYGGVLYFANNNATISNTGNTLFSGNSTYGSGGVIASSGALTIGNTGTITFTGNQAGTSGQGGAIYANGNVTIDQGVTFGGALATDGNSAYDGGAIYLGAAATQLSLNGTLFQNNASTYNAGAVVFESAGTITNTGNTAFDGNTTVNVGGAILANGGLTITNTGTLTFTGNQSTDVTSRAGAIYSGGNVTIGQGITFGGTNAADGNSAFEGGAIYLAATAASLSLDGTLFQNNTAGGYGGAVRFNNAASTLTNTGNTQFIDNTATINGGAIYAVGALTITNTGGGTLTFTGNQATGASGTGGAISANGNVNIGSGVTFDSNLASVGGGAIFLQTTATQLSLDGTTFQQNSANGTNGGAVNFGNSGATTLYYAGNTTFIDNSAALNGAAIYVAGALTLTNTGGGTLLFSGNTVTNAVGIGGAIGAEGNLTIGSGVTFDSNSSSQGGAIFLNTAATSLSLNGTTFKNNTAGSFAGAVHFANAGAVTLVNSGITSFASNTATTSGGAIFANDALTLTGSGVIDFSGNTASQGGAIYAVGNVTLDSGVTLRSDIDTDIYTPTFVLANGAALFFDLTNADDTTTNLAVAGAVNSLGTSTVVIDSWEIGTYKLMTATGGGIDAADFDLDTTEFMGREKGIFTSPTDGELILTMSLADLDLVWTGNTDGNWNSTASNNWHLAGTPAQSEMFMNGDSVTFDNTSAVKNVIVDNSGVTVSGMEITGGAYSLSGGKITGAALLVSGGSATFDNDMDFVNGLDIRSGATVEIGNDGILVSTMPIDNAGTLRFNRTNDYTFVNNITGSGNVTKTGSGKMTLDAASMSGNFSQQQGNVELAAGRTWSGNYTQTAGTFIGGNNAAVTGNATFTGIVDVDGILSTGLLTLDGAALLIGLAADNVSDKIIVAGTVNSLSASTIELSNWETGTFTLMTASGGIDFTKFDVDRTGLGSRQSTVLFGDAAKLLLTTSTDNLNLVWAGNTDGNWDTTTSGNWRDTAFNPERFNPNDYIIFDGTSVNNDVVVGNVTVSGMEITGGAYSLSGGKITGIYIPDASHTTTGKLAISGAATSVALNVETNFERGYTMSGGTLILGHNQALGTYSTDTTTPANSPGQLTIS
ncbi:MAG: hypothetical protein FWE67_04925, partial [Planctomycetaceae bacterium]|nr:hypothetical protein [Planctomycetaceae bacterium]